MKVLVAVKRVIDYNVKVRVRADETDVDLTNVKMSINPFCEIAVEEAVKLKEAGTATEVVAVAVGPQAVQEQLRTALAMGADRAVWVETETMPGGLAVARLLAQVVREEAPGLVILGKQAIDSDNNQTGQMLAALLDWPQATFASQLVVNGTEAEVTREIDGGLQTLAVRLPAVVTTDLRLNTPRYIKLPDIMKAKRKPIANTTPATLGVEPGVGLRLIGVTPPAERTGGIKVDSVAALVDALKNQARVL